MEEKVTIKLQNSDTVLPKGKRGILAFPSPLLVPCVITEQADGFEMECDMVGLAAFENVKKMQMQDKYRFLYNCSALFKLASEFSFSLTPDNIYMDTNLLPKLVRRDQGSTAEDAFLAQYKALLASVLAPKYSFEDYYNGGTDLFQKNSRLKKLCDMETVRDAADAMLKQYRIEEADTRKNKVVVGKGQLLFYRIALPVFTVIMIGCVALSIYLNFIRVPFEEQLIKGDGAYLANDYLRVQEELSGIDTTDLPYESKYILARSYVVSESLNSSQKENILTMLTMQTDAVYFDYWIELGRLNFESAIDAAQRIGDDQLLLLAYMKYELFLETDTSTMTGDEKAQKLSDLKNKIDSISKELEEARNDVSSGADTGIVPNATGMIVDNGSAAADSTANAKP